MIHISVPIKEVVKRSLLRKQKFHTCNILPTAIDHYGAYGEGGRNSFNGMVATVFGATGFLGRYVVNRLARGGAQVIVPYRGSEDDVRHIRVMGELGQIVFLNYDLRDMQSIEKCVTHSNVVLNLIGRNYPTRNFSLDDVIVGGAINIAQATKDSGVDHLIHVSALNAKPDSESHFMRAKAEAERAVADILPDVTIIRPAECFGQEDYYFNKYAYLRNLPFGVPLVGNGWSTTKRPVSVIDVAKGIVQAAKDKSSRAKTFELYGPEEYYLNDLVYFIFCMIKKPTRIYNVPKLAYRLAGFLGEQTVFSPKITRDLAIRQFLSENVSDDAYTFEDLGITPQNMNHAAIAVLRRHRQYYYQDQLVKESDFCPSVTSYNN